jgi:hypothetical protein
MNTNPIVKYQGFGFGLTSVWIRVQHLSSNQAGSESKKWGKVDTLHIGTGAVCAVKEGQTTGNCFLLNPDPQPWNLTLTPTSTGTGMELIVRYFLFSGKVIEDEGAKGEALTLYDYSIQGTVGCC